MVQINEIQYHLLDLVLCSSAFLSRCKTLQSHRDAALASDHYLLTATFEFDGEWAAANKSRKKNKEALHLADRKLAFTTAFADSVAHAPLEEDSVEGMWAATVRAMRKAEATLPENPFKSKQPWTSERTLHLIERRRAAWAAGDVSAGKLLLKEARKSVRKDKAA